MRRMFRRIDWKSPLLMLAFFSPVVILSLALSSLLESAGIYEVNAERIGAAASIVLWAAAIVLINRWRAKRNEIIYKLQAEIERLQHYEQDYEKLCEKYDKLIDREVS